MDDVSGRSGEVRIPSHIEDHGGWLVWHDPLPVEWRDRDWCFARKKPSSQYDYQFDYGREESREMCLQTIDYLESEEEREANEPAKSEPSEAFLKFTNVPLVNQLGAALIAANSVLACNGRGFADGMLLGQVKAALDTFKEWQRVQSDDASPDTPSPKADDQGVQI